MVRKLTKLNIVTLRIRYRINGVSIKNPTRITSTSETHGEKFWTHMRSKYTDLGEFETI